MVSGRGGAILFNANIPNDFQVSSIGPKQTMCGKNILPRDVAFGSKSRLRKLPRDRMPYGSLFLVATVLNDI